MLDIFIDSGKLRYTESPLVTFLFSTRRWLICIKYDGWEFTPAFNGFPGMKVSHLPYL